MQVIAKPRTTINISDIYAMRHSGATLQQIANKTDRTKERIRQILISNYGSAKHKLMSTEQLRKVSGFSRHLILKLYQDNVITPVREWNVKNSHHLLWPPATVGQIIAYYGINNLCKMCHSRIPEGRRIFCSDQCYKEGHKYKYKDKEAKQRHMASIRRYREKCKRLSKSLLIDSPKREKVLV